MAAGQRVAVGYDGRLTSPELEQALVDGLRASGMQVLRIGRGPTPMLYYTATTLETDGAVMVTGSHNPPDYNGFKMMLGRKPFFGEQILEIGASRRGRRCGAGGCRLRTGGRRWRTTTWRGCCPTGTAATGC